MATLLLADDSVIVQRMIAMTFAAENIGVTTVSDGEQAIARIARDRPDIVLAGIATPKRSGYDVAAFVKSKPHLAAIPVLLLASAFDPVDQIRAAQVRCDGVLVKPLDPHQVIARVKELIAGSAAATAVTRPDTPPGEGLDDYFDQLDAALAQRSTSAPPSRTTDSGVVPTLDSVLTPGPPATLAASGAFVNDALVDEVTRRVIERLGTTALRDTVADVVSAIAERLIQEEIARIRSK